MTQVLTDGSLALPQLLDCILEMAQFGFAVVCAVDLLSRNVHVTSRSVEGVLTVRSWKRSGERGEGRGLNDIPAPIRPPA